jgi:hypothetical protein
MGESDSTETHPSKPVCDSDNRATNVASQVKNLSLRIRLQGSDPEQLRGGFHFGNPVGNFVDDVAHGRPLVSKVEKSGELFALEMQRDEAPLSS